MVGQHKKVNKNNRKRPLRSLKAIEPHAAGINLGSREHWVAGPPRNEDSPNVARFGTTTPKLVRLADWLAEQGVKTVAMESTGVYWIPLFEILDCCGFKVVLANARQLHHVPGRKTDMIDCQWLQNFTRYPPRAHLDTEDLMTALTGFGWCRQGKAALRILDGAVEQGAEKRFVRPLSPNKTIAKGCVIGTSPDLGKGLVKNVTEADLPDQDLLTAEASPEG